MKAFIYARVSTDEQAEQGKSIETQLKICRKWAKENAYQITGEFIDDGKSATNLNRPALKDLLAKCLEKGVVDAILVQDTDRLARNTYDHLTVKTLLKKKDVKVISISQLMIDDSPEGNLIDTIIASVNAFQSQITGRKTSKVLEEKAKLGWYPGGRPPLGYKNIENPNPTSTLDKKIIGIDEPVSIHIKKAFEMYSTGNFNVTQIANFLNKKGVKPPYGVKIHPSLVARILQDEFYIKRFLWNGKVYVGKHPALIDTPLFNHVQSVLQAHNQNATRKRKHLFLLRGYLYCITCGKRYWGELHKKPNGSIYNFYFCSNCKKDTYVDKDKLEKQVIKLFHRIQISKEYRDAILEKAKSILAESRSNQETDKKRLIAQKTKLEKAMKEAEDNRFIHHTLSEDAFQRIYPRFENQLKDVEEALAKLGNDYSQNIHKLEKILRLAENIGKAYQKADDMLKRVYLTIFFKDFTVKGEKIASYTLNPKIKPLIEKGSIRVLTTGLPREDSNLKP